MPRAKLFHAAQRPNEMTLRRLLSNGDERVRRSTKRGDNNRRLTLEPAGDNVSGACDGVGVLHGSAAELDDDHAGSITPLATSISAFITDPPAAPRTVLCPIATRRMSRMGSLRTRPTVTVMPPPLLTSRFGCG